MPMRWGRAVKYVKEGRGVFRIHRKLGIKYLELLVSPKTPIKNQEITLGFDPGSVFDGFSVVSNTNHHENFEIIHNKKIKDRMKARKEFRAIRRCKNLRNRPCRFDSRTSPKELVPTLRSMYDFREWITSQIFQLYPISQIVYEKPKFNFWKKNNKFGANAQQVMQGLSKYVDYIKNRNITVIEKSGKFTKDKRIEIFGIDFKSSNKSDKSFFSHCIDSYSLAFLDNKNFDRIRLNKKTRFISKIWHNRRELYKEKSVYSRYDSNKCYYKKFHKGGIVEILNPWYGEINKSSQVKVQIQNYSNSFKNMRTEYVPRTPRVHKFKARYGGTVYNGISKYGRYKNLETGEILSNSNSRTCNLISRNLDKYKLIDYKRRNIEVIR